MVEIHMHYEGGLRCSARHAPSGSTLSTDAPVDNHGRGEAFSPTDLLATSLGTCMLTTMGIVAKNRGWNIDGIDANVIKEMTKSPPRSVARLTATVRIPSAVAGRFDAATRAELEQAAHRCPVRLSLHPQVDVPITFRWGD